VGREGRGEPVVQEVKLALIRTYVKAGLLDQLDQKNASSKERNSMGNYGNCVLNALPFFEDRISNVSLVSAAV